MGFGYWEHSGAPWVSFAVVACSPGVVGFIRGLCVHSGAPWGMSDSFVGVVFIRVRAAGR